jgi:nicotinate-nucleotide adenylyltransferase
MPIEPSCERICMFGGTFDPIHEAHLRIACEAQKKFSLSRVWFVPAGNPPHKESAGLAPYECRYQMVEIACRQHPGFEASRLEAAEDRSYTVDTIRRFRGQMKTDFELYFLIGADAFDELETWKGWQDLLGLTGFIVVARPDSEYRVPAGAHVQRLDGLALPVSSSTIRARLAAGKPTPELPSAVRAYIEAHDLYSFGKGNASVL